MSDTSFKVPAPPLNDQHDNEFVNQHLDEVQDDLPAPPAGVYVLEVMKNGTIVQSVPINKPIIRFGRTRDCDVPLEHPSISRLHAELIWKQTGDGPTGKFFLKDMGSTHGTVVNKTKLPAGLMASVQPNNNVIRLGGSTRSFILNSLIPNDENDEDSEEDGDGEAGYGDEDEEQETDPELLFEQFCNLAANPTTNASKNENSFSDQPHRVLLQWFEREGYEFSYDVTQQETKFKCTIDIPIEGRDVRIEGLESQPRKKDAIDHTCLIACRILDQTSRLYPWQNKRSGGSKRRHDPDDEDDEVLDETEQNKKSKSSGSSGDCKSSAAETFESLNQKWHECKEQLSGCKASLVSLKLSVEKKTVAAGDDEELDSLDSYMSSVSDVSNKRDIRIKQSQLKAKIKELEKKQHVYELLMKAAAPASLPKTTDAHPEPASVTQVSDDMQVLESKHDDVKANESSEKADTEKTSVKLSLKAKTPAPLLTTSAAAVFAEPEPEPTTSKKPAEVEDRKVIQSVTKSVERAIQEQKKKEKMTTVESDSDFVDWCPPVGQDGSGRTTLNDKLGY